MVFLYNSVQAEQTSHQYPHIRGVQKEPWLFGVRQEVIPLVQNSRITPRKINIEPENDGLEDDFPFAGVYSQVPC